IAVRWIAGHRNVEGNETADREAKAAAECKENSSLPGELPPELHSPLPDSISALKQCFNKELNLLWSREWKRSSRFQHIFRLAPELPSKSFLNL
ncbi:hypothetical protein EDD15DRAFT_2117232, partial [Pisolithus albus]